MRKKFSTLFLAAMFSVLFCLPAVAAEKVYELAFTSIYTDRHDIVQKVYKPWIEEVKTLSGGRLAITYYNPNTLCPDIELLDSLIKGQVQVGSHLTARNPGRLPLNTVLYGVALRFPTSRSATATYLDLLKEYPALLDEFKGIKVLWVHASAPTQLHTRNTAITKLEELASVKLLCPTNESMRMVRALGANAIMQPNIDMYLSLSRNMAEGVLQPIAPMRSFKLDEATKYHSLVGLMVGPLWGGMNQEAYDSLPADLRKIIDDTTKDMSMKLADTLYEADSRDMQWMIDKGHIYNTVPKEELARWRPIVDKANREHFMQQMENRDARGINLNNLYEDALKFAEKNIDLYEK